MPKRNRIESAAAPLPDFPCACASARRASRLISQMYGRHLREYATEPSEMTLLMVLAAWPGKSQVALSRMIGLDKTSLSRNLSLLKGKGIVEAKTVPGRRELGFFLTAAGERRLKAAKSGWSRAQAELRSAMTAREWDAMWRTLHTLSRVAYTLQVKYEAE